jgi:hypothetical protein
MFLYETPKRRATNIHLPYLCRYRSLIIADLVCGEPGVVRFEKPALLQHNTDDLV